METLLLMNKFPSASTILVDMNGSSERAVPIAKQLMTLSNVFPSICFKRLDGHNADEVAEAILGNEHQKVILCQTHKGFPCPTLLDNPYLASPRALRKRAEVAIEGIGCCVKNFPKLR